MDFCIRLAAQVMADEVENTSSPKNTVLSPFSITMILNMLASGSGGKTLKQFLQLLGHRDTEELNLQSAAMTSLLTNDSAASTANVRTRKRKRNNGESESLQRLGQKKNKFKDLGPRFCLANALWVDRRLPLNPDFKKNTESLYKALLVEADLTNKVEKLRLTEKMNSWAKKKTEGLVKEILPHGLRLSQPLSLANAVYFKGDWESAFKASNTRNEYFHSLNGKTKVPFMIKERCRYMYGSFEDFKLLKLQYKQGQRFDKQFAMYIFLPHEQNGLKDLVHKFNSNPSLLHPENFCIQNQKFSEVWIPKLKFSCKFNARNLITRKGLTLPFNEAAADFTNMVDLVDPRYNAYIESIHHNACIEVDEKGTKAAAVTSAAVGLIACGRWSTLSFVADHPFMFMIVEDRSKLITFVGAVLDPAS